MNTVWFAHGKESGPQGHKIMALSAVAEGLGWKAISPDYRGLNDPEDRVERLLELFQANRVKTVLVGSSMGGYVSLLAAQELAPEGLFLMAPAIGIDGYRKQDPELRAGQAVIVHGWQDDIIPAQQVITYAKRHHVPLHLLPDDHPLGSSLPQLCSLFRDFLIDVADAPDAVRLAPHI